jgi:hypothetical protein
MLTFGTSPNVIIWLKIDFLLKNKIAYFHKYLSYKKDKRAHQCAHIEAFQRRIRAKKHPLLPLTLHRHATLTQISSAITISDDTIGTTPAVRTPPLAEAPPQVRRPSAVAALCFA